MKKVITYVCDECGSWHVKKEYIKKCYRCKQEICLDCGVILDINGKSQHEYFCERCKKLCSPL